MTIAPFIKQDGLNSMASSTLNHKLKDFNQWKVQYLDQLRQYEPWLKKYKLFNDEVESVFKQSTENIVNDQLKVVLIGEFSRGKTELINALFFADLGRRLLPSSAGRTTMCPVEILYNPKVKTPYLHLLPIESKLTDMSLNRLRQQPDNWLKYDLDLTNAVQTEKKLAELSGTKKVSFEDAANMGLLTAAISNKNDSRVEVPRWRHAIISFPHPLLKRGLVVFDTPGLNAIGNEPELTLHILPSAQATLFVLGADTGVSRSDLTMWDNYLSEQHQRNNDRLMVVLNKIDTLWDDLSSQDTIYQNIQEQQQDVAKVLNVNKNCIFPLSAQKALVSKIRKDTLLLKKSGILELESYLTTHIVNRRQKLIVDSVSTQTSKAIINIQAIVMQRVHTLDSRIKIMTELQTKSDGAIQLQLKKTLKEKEKYAINLTEFKACEFELDKQSRSLKKLLNLEDIDNIIQSSQEKMSKTWTTKSMKGAMKTIFDLTQERMIEVVAEVKELRTMVRAIYRRFQSQHHFEVIDPRMLSLVEQQIELDSLYQEAEIFRKSTRATLSEQHFVVQHFIVTYIQQLQNIFNRTERNVTRWLGTTLQPLGYQVRDHRYTLASQVRELKTAQTSRDTIKIQLKKLHDERIELKHQMTGLRRMSINLQTKFTSS